MNALVLIGIAAIVVLLLILILTLVLVLLPRARARDQAGAPARLLDTRRLIVEPDPTHDQADERQQPDVVRYGAADGPDDPGSLR